MLPSKRSLIASAVFLATLGLSGCGGGGSSSPTTPTPDPDPTPTNTAPTDIALSANEVTENDVAAVIGELSATDSDAGDTFTFAVDDQRFTVDGVNLQLAADTALDFEKAATVDLNVTVTDSANNTFSKAFTINVTDLLDYYGFESQFDDSSSVSYTGQIARHLLIADLFTYIGSHLKADIDGGSLTNKADVVAKLMSYYQISDVDYGDVVADRPLLISTRLDKKQASVGAVSSSHKDLFGKVAGQDEVGQHKDWSTSMAGWGQVGDYTPDSFARMVINMIADNAQTYIDGAQRMDPQGQVITELYLSDNGIDLRQLLQKFLLGAVAFSQATDDYLDDDVAGKGFNSDNTQAVDGKSYTSLEHQFDEGFGYFGAARNYLDYSDDEVGSKGGRDDWQGHQDTDGDGMIDLTAELNFHNSTNAAKRDRGTAGNANPTDYSKVIFEAFLQGRQIITSAGGALSDQQMTDLKAQRDIIVLNWEKAISSTVVHYINDTIADIEKLGTDDYNYADAAKHWAEMKGFAMNLQFNPRSLVSDEQFVQIHQLIGDMSVSSADDVADYKAKLLQARDILQAAYNFDADNVANW